MRPANIGNIVAINQGVRPLTKSLPDIKPLGAVELSGLLEAGSICIDTRSQASFGGSHIPGAYSIQLSSSEFEQRVGWVTPQSVPICLIAETAVEAQNALRKLAFVGLDSRVQGYLSGGMEQWLDAGLRYHTVPQISVYQLSDMLEAGEGMNVLDVRETSEWDEGHIERAHHLNYKFIEERIGELTLDKDNPIAVICAGGLRSSTAGSILLMKGFSRVYNTTGGAGAWRAAGLPMIDKDGTIHCKMA